MANNYYQATVWPELPASLFSEVELQSLACACGLQHERSHDRLYFFAEECFCEEGDDLNDQRLNCLEILQAKLRLLDPAAYRHIAIEGAASCSKMRPGEFGGFAYFITRDAIRSVSTSEWLHAQAR